MTDANYAQLLENLRHDLQLDPARDVLGGVLVANDGVVKYESVGTVLVTFTAANVTPPVVVPHGLPRTPRIFLQNASGLTCLDAVLTAITATTFTVEAYTTDRSVTTLSANFYWRAIA